LRPHHHGSIGGLAQRPRQILVARRPQAQQWSRARTACRWLAAPPGAKENALWWALPPRPSGVGLTVVFYKAIGRTKLLRVVVPLSVLLPDRAWAQNCGRTWQRTVSQMQQEDASPVVLQEEVIKKLMGGGTAMFIF
jgi:hypothetical protein